MLIAVPEMWIWCLFHCKLTWMFYIFSSEQFLTFHKLNIIHHVVISEDEKTHPPPCEPIMSPHLTSVLWSSSPLPVVWCEDRCCMIRFLCWGLGRWQIGSGLHLPLLWTSSCTGWRASPGRSGRCSPPLPPPPRWSSVWTGPPWPEGLSPQVRSAPPWYDQICWFHGGFSVCVSVLIGPPPVLISRLFSLSPPPLSLRRPTPPKHTVLKLEEPFPPSTCSALSLC